MRTVVTALDVSTGKATLLGKAVASMVIPSVGYRFEELRGTFKSMLNIRIRDKILTIPVADVRAALEAKDALTEE